MPPPEVLTFVFKDAGGIPNNPMLPVVIYKRVAAAGLAAMAMADWYEGTWPKHGWRPAWRFGVYDFPHYHSTAHEILGVYRGQATLRLGAEAGVTVVAEAGDVLVLPAGTGHQNLGSSRDSMSSAATPRANPPIFCAVQKAIGRRQSNASPACRCRPRTPCKAPRDPW